ncbi:MAG: UDP-2,3-diacylglucosamine diphosphatase [Planctomycetota bacterium]|nr:UDP-2,3-diacylglucosamine diphosphatase [Planctomycetota bacterium]
MDAIVISDLHLGSRYVQLEHVLRFFRTLPDAVPLILNGDIVDRVHHPLPDQHAPVLDLIRDESLRRQVVWVYGNHDDGYQLDDPGGIEFCRSFRLGQRLFVSHGYDFDNVMTRYQPFVKMFNKLHKFRLWLGAEPVHVAQYAKQWALCYQYLRRSVMASAIAYARANGFAAITCGHTHFAEDLTVDGIRYINTGAWTELPAYFLAVHDDSMELHKVE